MIWLQIALFVVSFALTVLFAPKPEFENQRPKTLEDVNFPRATEDAPNPLILGKVRNNAPNATWYGDFFASPIKEKLKVSLFRSALITVGHEYKLGLDLALGMGPGLVLTEIWCDDKLLWEGTTSATVPTVINLDEPSFFGGYKEGGGMSGTLRYYPGGFTSTSNPVNAYMEGILGAGAVPGYLGSAHIVFEGVNIGESAQLRKLAFVLENYTNDLAGLPNAGKVGDDMNPAEAIYQITTHTWRGMGVADSNMDLTELAAIGTTLHAEGNGVSILITAETQGKTLIQEIIRQIDGGAFQDPDTGKIIYRLIRNNYVVNDLPLFDETDIMGIQNFARSGWQEVVAQVKVSYPQRNSDSNKVAESQDMAVVAQLGRMKSVTMSMPFCYDADTANAIAARERSQLSVPLFRMKIDMTRTGNTLRPTDPFRIDWPEFGISNLVMRVEEFDFGALLNGKLIVTCLQDTFAVNTPVFGPPADTGWTAPDTTPTNITVKDLVEMPRFYQTKLEFPIIDGFAGVIPFAETPSAASTAWDMVVGTATGDANLDTAEPTYADFTATGTLPADYDKDAGLATGIDATGITVTGVTGAFVAPTDLAEMQTGETGIAYIGGEWIGFLGVTDNGGGSFTLTNVHRAILGTLTQTHLAGTRLWAFDAFYLGTGAMDDLTEAGTAFYKMLDRVGARVEGLSEVTEANTVMASLADRPIRPRNVRLDGNRAAIQIDNNLNLNVTWVNTDREDVILPIELDATESPDQAETYDVDIMIGGVRDNDLSGVGVTAPYVVPFSSFPPAGGVDNEVRAYSRRTVGNLRSSAAYARIPFEIFIPVTAIKAVEASMYVVESAPTALKAVEAAMYVVEAAPTPIKAVEAAMYVVEGVPVALQAVEAVIYVVETAPTPIKAVEAVIYVVET